METLKPIVAKMVSDMKFMAIATIVSGGLNCLSIIGAVVGIPLIIAGLRLKDAAEAFTSYIHNNDMASLQRAMEQQRTYFFIHKIMFIVGISLAILIIVLFITLGGFAFLNMMNEMQGY